MTIMISRRPLLLGGAALVLAGCSGGAKGAAEGDMALGAPEGAKVTVVEYASVTCHVCAAWQEEVWPGFKAKYVDTNKVRYVFREIPTPPVEVATAGFLLARCAGEDKYFDVVHEMLASVKSWDAGVPPRQTLLQIANGVGIDQQQLQQCITDEDAIKALEARITAANARGVTGTPAFFVNDVAVTDRTLDGLSAAIDAALAKA
nr:DsbA family protein [Brevundimonas subvibrioides]